MSSKPDKPKPTKPKAENPIPKKAWDKFESNLDKIFGKKKTKRG